MSSPIVWLRQGRLHHDFCLSASCADEASCRRNRYCEILNLREFLSQRSEDGGRVTRISVKRKLDGEDCGIIRERNGEFNVRNFSGQTNCTSYGYLVASNFNDVSQSFANEQNIVAVVCLDSQGNVEQTNMVIENIVETYSLSRGDKQRIFSERKILSSVPTIVVKESAILINIFGIRCIVSERKALFFDHETDVTKKFLKFLIHQVDIWTRSDVSVRPNYLDKDCVENDLVENDVRLFNLVVLTCCLDYMCFELDAELRSLQKITSESLSDSSVEVRPSKLYKFATTKQMCTQLKSRAEGLNKVLAQLLTAKNKPNWGNFKPNGNQDEAVGDKQNRDSESLNESIRKVANYESVLEGFDEDKEEKKEEGFEAEIEDMLEHYKRLLTGIEFQADYILERIRVSKESFEVSLSMQRFEASRLRLNVSIITFACALVALILTFIKKLFILDLYRPDFFVVALALSSIVLLFSFQWLARRVLGTISKFLGELQGLA